MIAQLSVKKRNENDNYDNYDAFAFEQFLSTYFAGF